ncbi:class I SAM-dependent rRNA methyltransferase [Aciduricibacillus chroicocephali]|uniref:Class I SAM-dependent rRNA methyltransferase n=1 Tax=Aciduricibacillus chroicocephali TaxID=3054939 RepID=A0ABY9KWA6_9BACI|nr:class I SAM-dependent rRNA methyltransferase [Bacillaceae bacterium 44XB]
MRQVIDLQAEKKATARFVKGYPLIEKDTVRNESKLKEEGSIIQLIDSEGKFLGKGYYGIQNKGIGWILTQNQNEQIDEPFFNRKISEAVAKRSSFFKDEETTAFRLFNGEGDGVGGLIIDYYEGFCVIQWYSEGIYSFRKEILSALESVVHPSGVYEKKRFEHGGKYVEDRDHVRGEEAPSPLLVKENGRTYAVHLDDGAMVGIFLDQRDVRQAIYMHYAQPDSKVLNTFSYTGAFSVPAALAGAHTTSVDLAKRSRPKTIEQFEVNGIDSETQDIVVMDVFDYFKYARRKELSFDMVILDPPSFARSKKRTFSTSKDYPALLKDAALITNGDGYIIASTNNASFGMDKFKKFIAEGMKSANFNYKICETFSLPDDFTVNRNFREGNYLKVVVLQKLS